MSIHSAYNTIVLREKFTPRFIGFFIGHNFLIRRALQKSIRQNAVLLTGSLLDFGCGTKPYETLFINVDEYLGIEMKIEGRDQSHLRADKFYNGNTIPYDSEKFDSILCTEVLEHVFNVDSILKEFNRVLKEGGRALITTPFMWEEHEMPHDFARYTSAALIHLYEKNGFKVLKSFKTGNYVELLFQFNLMYIKNILPDKNKIVRQVLMLPFIIFYNFFGVLFSFLLPTDKTAYFNNVFVIEKL
jgi:SAM-dependent methyltransferase